MYAYDIYSLTDESSSVSQPRQAGYEEQALTFKDRVKHPELWDGEAKKPAAVPKNVLIEVPAEQELTTERSSLVRVDNTPA